MKSKRDNEGYVMVDSRASPGITEAFIRSCGKNPDDVIFAGEGKLMEAATIVCSHCQKVLLRSPTRTRERGYCPKCDHYVCDQCNLQRVLSGRECNVMLKRIEKVQELAFLLEQRNGIILS